MNEKIKLKIADIIIQMQSRFSFKQFNEEDQEFKITRRFKNFCYSGRQKPDILINIEIADKLPSICADTIFVTNRFDGKTENWRLLKRNNTYIYKSSLLTKMQLMLVNTAFNKVTAYLLSRGSKDKAWAVSDIIYDFLQFLLISYFAFKDKGIFIHAAGIKDIDGKGLIFAGPSGCGKTTTAKFWHSHTKAMVLNDDRIIICMSNGKFFIYGSPWHGEFSDYLVSRIESASLEKLFFIHHAAKNTVEKISQKESFSLLYPSIFPVFWNKSSLENVVSFMENLVKKVSCYKLGFVNNKEVVNFVRSVK